jgi:sulfoxide reductase heme-binding subunit YedZ
VSTLLARAEAPVRRWIRPALWALVVVPAPLLIAQLLLGQLGANPIEKLEALAGEWTLRFLIGSLAVTPLMRLTGWGWLVAQRRFLGLAAFFWALGHVVIYMVDRTFDWNDMVDDVLKRLFITLGMLAFVLMIPLALTSTKASIRRLGGARWNRLHALVYVSVIAACLHFFWAVKKDVEEPILYGAVVAALLAFRIVWRPARRPSPSGRATPNSPAPDA